MKPIFCTVKDHSDNPMNLICMEDECPCRGLICSFCLLNDHQDHVQMVFPLKVVIASLNKANNPNKQQELHTKGHEIFEKHHKIKQVFKSNLIEIKDLLNKLEKDLDKQIKQLDIEADLFVGDAFEKSIQELNSEVLTKQQIENAIEKIAPLLSFSQGEVQILREQEINIQSAKLIKTADIIERESKYWLEKCLADLRRLETTCQTAILNKQVQIKTSKKRQITDNVYARYAIDYDQWNLKETDAVAFKSKINQDIWLSGVGIYKITQYPTEALQYQVQVFEGKKVSKKNLIYQQIQNVDPSLFASNSNIGRFDFTKALKIEPNKLYAIGSNLIPIFKGLKPSSACLSFYGTNIVVTDDFEYEDAEFSSEYSDNSTSTNQGVIPVLYYEE